MRGFSSSLSSLLLSLALGAIGGVLFQLANIPLAWMLGPLCANLIAAMGKLPVKVPERFRSLFLGMLGLVLGGKVTPELVHRVVDWPVSIALLCLGVLISTMVVAAWYRRCGFDRVSALYASTPGAMTAMILLGEQAGGDPRRIAVAQSLRVLIVIFTLPAVFWHFEAPSGEAGMILPEAEGVWLMLALPLMIWLGHKLHLPNAAMLGPMICAALLGGFDVLHFQPSGWAVNVMLWVLGSAIGARFAGLALRMLLRYAGQTVIATFLALAVMAIFAELIHYFIGVPRDAALLALAPGGLGEMALVALSLDIDPVFVTFHQLIRVIGLVFIAPWIIKFLAMRQCQESAR